ncbi:MAG: hypothetical protein JO111_03425 [Caulobacteraceae bacterium]|nr:hypothetical protein [Caulobacteraceae bacterium]
MADAPGRRQRFWLTAGEIVGVLALVIAGLNYWEGRQQHAEANRQAESSARAEAAFVAVGAADREGRSIVISPLKAAQAIQTQRYLFPKDLSASPHEINAARPEIDVGWIAEGLRAALGAAHAKGAGEGVIPVAVETTYVEEGDERTDLSLYRVGYSWKPRLFGGEQIRLRGLALVRRGLTGDAQKLVDARWEAERPKPPA